MKRVNVALIFMCIFISIGCAPSENKNRPAPIYGQCPAIDLPLQPSVYNQYLVTNITQLIISDGTKLGDYYSFEHEGHLYVVSYGYGFIHSPACSCLKKTEFENE